MKSRIVLILLIIVSTLNLNCSSEKLYKSESIDSYRDRTNVRKIKVSNTEILDLATIGEIVWVSTKTGVFRTKGDFEDWEKIYENDLEPENSISKLAFADPLRGILISESVKSMQNSSFSLKVTSDGGKNWKTSKIIKNAEVSKIYVDETGFGLAVGTKLNPSYFHQDYMILESNDYGNTWMDASPICNLGDESNRKQSVFSSDGISDVSLDFSGSISLQSYSGKLLRKDNQEWIIKKVDKHIGVGKYRNIRFLSLDADNYLSIGIQDTREGFGTLFISDVPSLNYTISGINIFDAVSHNVSKVIGCGSIHVTNEIEKTLGREGAIWYSDNFRNWKILYQDKCESGNCSIKKIVPNGNDMYYFVSDNNDGGFLVLNVGNL